MPRYGYGSDVAFFLPDFPVGADGLEHGFGGLVQPLSFLFREMMEDGFARGFRTQMDVGGFPSHGVEQAEFSFGGAQGSEFDAGAEGAEAADDPASAQLNEGIGTADGVIDDGLIKDFGGALLLRLMLPNLKALSPMGRRRDEGFGFAGDASAMPVGDGDVARVAETAEAGNAVREAVRDAGSGH